MNLDDVVMQLRNYAPMFEGRVGGAADFAAGIEPVSTVKSPAAFVLPLEDAVDTIGDPSVPGLYQDVTQRIGVVVQLSNAADRRGQASAWSVAAARSQVFRAILNWRPGVTVDGGPSPDGAIADGEIASASGFLYAGGSLLVFDRARLYWQFEFTLAGTITDSDGFRVAGHALDAIDARVIHPVGLHETGIAAMIELEK